MATEIKNSSALVHSQVTLIHDQNATITRHHENVKEAAAVIQSALVEANKLVSQQESLSSVLSAPTDSTAFEEVRNSVSSVWSAVNGIEARVATLEQPCSGIAHSTHSVSANLQGIQLSLTNLLSKVKSRTLR